MHVFMPNRLISQNFVGVTNRLFMSGPTLGVSCALENWKIGAR